MNSFFKHYKSFYFLSLGMISLAISLHAVTFRNEPLTNFIEAGQVLCANVSENSFVILEIGNDNFDILYEDINKLDNLKEDFQEIIANRSGASFNSKFLNMTGNVLNYNSAYLGGRENINLQTRTSLKFAHCILESPFISITGNEMEFIDSFLINPKVLNIIIDYPETHYDIIQLLFYDQPENPTIITGEINLKDNQATKRLIISNVKEIRMQFIWDKDLPKDSQDSQNSQPSPELTPDAFPDDLINLTPSEDVIEEIIDQSLQLNSELIPNNLSDDLISVAPSQEIIESIENQNSQFSPQSISNTLSDGSTRLVPSLKILGNTPKKSNSQSRSVYVGFAERFRQVIIAFYKKYILSYF